MTGQPRHLATLLLLGIALAVIPATAAPLITEFLADNETVLLDEDGVSSDWIEIFNPDAATVDLGGYHLTDDPAIPAKWSFPVGTILAPSGFLVVFASGNDRTVAGSELHTNFKIDSNGEYLALVAPDGTTILSEFTPTFPLQFDDISYGPVQLGSSTPEILVEIDSACTAHVPENGILGTTWTQTGFDDSSWTSGILGVGYERSSGYQNYININVEQQMFNQPGTLYVRVPFTVTNAHELADLELELQYDDGFILYLNGTRVTGANDPAVPSWNSPSEGENYDVNAVQFEPFPLGTHVNLLQDGANVIAIHGMNRTTNSSDLLIRPRLTATRLTNPGIGDPTYFLSPTPGAANGTQQTLPTSIVGISEPSRTFTTPLQVTLDGALPGQTIHYTLDGNIPTTASAAYSSPITISNSTQLRARIFGANNATGPLAMETYLRLASDLQAFNSNLPIVILENWNAGKPGTDNNVDGFWAIIEPDAATDNRADMLDPLHVGTRCGMRRRGSSSAGWNKYSLALESRDEDGLDKGIKPLGMPRESDWVLSGRYVFDRALMRNPLVYRLSNEAGEYAVRTRFVEVFNNTGGGSLSYAGDYFGVYTLMEKIKRDDKRVDVAPIDPGDITEPDVTGGYIFKKDRLDPGDGGFSVNRMNTMAWVEPKEEDVVPGQQSWLVDHLNEFDLALYRSDGTHPTTGKHFTGYIDTGSWIRHHWLNTLAKNVDGFRLSGYYYKNRIDTNGGKVGAGPVWDFDRTMQSTDGRDDSPTTWDGTGDSSGTWNDSRFPWWGKALEDPDFRQAHTDLWQELRKSVFSWTNIESVINEFAAELDHQDPSGANPGKAVSPAARNFVRWSENSPRGGSHASEVTILKNWLQSRGTWIDSQYTAQPVFTTTPGLVSPGTTVSFNTAAGTVYATTDNTDPRAPGGSVSIAASPAQPITINQTTIITARCRNGSGLTAWSGPVKGTFLVGPIANATNLVVTELHYAPIAPSTPAELAVSLDPSDFEFMELTNISPTDTIDLTDVHFEAGVDFTFTGSAVTTLAPGQRVLLVRNQAAFEARYGTSHSTRIAGSYAPDRLDNAGEHIHLVNALGQTIADFTYNDKHPWPTEAGFPGYSLVLNSSHLPAPDYTLASNWRSSGLLGGNPNASDSTPLTGAPDADDDQDNVPKLLEHALGTSDSDPTDASTGYWATVQPVTVDDVTDHYLTITHHRDLSADDVTLTPELSFDLTNWASGDLQLIFVSETNLNDGTSLVTHRTALPHDPATTPRTFLRLKATMP